MSESKELDPRAWESPEVRLRVSSDVRVYLAQTSDTGLDTRLEALYTGPRVKPDTAPTSVMTESVMPATAESGTMKEQYRIVGIAKPVVSVSKIM